MKADSGRLTPDHGQLTTDNSAQDDNRVAFFSNVQGAHIRRTASIEWTVPLTERV
jgi:hypothetical protein